MYRTTLLIGFTLLALLFSCSSNDAGLPDTVDFNLHIKPILSDRCFACHGPDNNTREADLALHTEEGAFAILDEARGHYVIKPGNTRASEVYQRIISEEADYVMPPPESNLSMTEEEVALIGRWIEQGATWEDHWSFIPPEEVTVPKSKGWGNGPIDVFVHRKMRSRGLKPNDEAERGKLLRRMTFDLTGLPPTAEAMDQVLNSTSDDWYEEAVDAALSNAGYGERMASIWLDLARYADSHGYQDDRPRTMWPWRNWVIKAFNENMPYDQFTIWQLAGDLLPDSLYEQRLATGFQRNHAITQEGGIVEAEYLAEYTVDRVDVFATGFLGLTVQCARCHDHKYDPISQKDFYQLYAFFNNLEGERGKISYTNKSPVPSMREENPVLENTIAQTITAIDALERRQREMQLTGGPGFDEWQEKFDEQKFAPEDALVHFSLDEQQGWRFRNTLDESHEAKVNVNLPPRIARPRKVSSRFGSALEFDGENFLTLGDVGDFEWYDPFTLSAWVKQSGRLQMEGGIIARRNGELQRNGYDLFMKPNGQIGLRLVHSLNDKHVEVVSKARVPVGSWKHIAASSSGGGFAKDLHLYIDGVEQDLIVVRDSLDRSEIACGNNLLVGNWNHRARVLQGKLAGFRGGAVDEVKIFDRRLAGPEISSLAERRARPRRSELQELYLLNHSQEFAKLEHQLDSLRRGRFSVPYVMIMEERDTVAPTYVLERGAYDALGEQVSRSTPESVLPFSDKYEANRLGLAEWLFDPSNPLTARVMVNRLWQQCFGRGLVATPEDFGSQGKLPSHPELLDWLANEFSSSGWDIKHMLKLMVMSATYRQSADVHQDELEKDKENIWLARGPYRPLTAEMIRDQALAISGLLNPKIGGKWVKPYQPEGIWKDLANQIGENKYRPSKGKDLYRRSLYTYWKRTIPPPTMLTMDASERAVCTVKRQMTSTPLQALVLLNDPTYVESARQLADVLIRANGEDLDRVLADAFQLFTARQPTTKELVALRDLQQDLADEFDASPRNMDDWLGVGSKPISGDIDRKLLAATTATLSTILNLDEAKHY